MFVTWFDGDSESDSEEESAKLVIALSSVCNSHNDSSDEEVTFEELVDSYKKLCIRSAEVCQQNEKQKKLIVKLEAEKKADTATISHLKGEVLVLNSKLDQMTKSVRMLTTRTDKLEEILHSGQNAGNMSGLGFVAAKESAVDKKKTRPDKQMSKQMSQHRAQHQEQRNMKKKYQRWRCHYYGRFGHIKPFCFRLYGYPNQTPYVKPKTNRTPYTQQWKKKTTALIAHTSLRVSAKEDWYFDSGCSKHM